MSGIKRRNVSPSIWGGWLGGGGGVGGERYACSNRVASQSKKFFFAELCFVCAGWCFLLLFMYFFHSIACFGSVFFLDSNRPDNPGKHTDHGKILRLSYGNGQRTESKGEIAETNMPTSQKMCK